MQSFQDILGRWPSLYDLASDLHVEYGVVKQWRRRNSVPPDRWLALVAAAEGRNILLTVEELAAAAERREQVRLENRSTCEHEDAA